MDADIDSGKPFMVEHLVLTGNPSQLPCPFQPLKPEDRPKLVLWYKKGTSSPIVRWETFDRSHKVTESNKFYIFQKHQLIQNKI